MYTPIETARFNDVDPEAWLAEVIARIAVHPINQIDDFLLCQAHDRTASSQS